MAGEGWDGRPVDPRDGGWLLERDWERDGRGMGWEASRPQGWLVAGATGRGTRMDWERVSQGDHTGFGVGGGATNVGFSLFEWPFNYTFKW